MHVVNNHAICVLSLIQRYCYRYKLKELFHLSWTLNYCENLGIVKLVFAPSLKRIKFIFLAFCFFCLTATITKKSISASTLLYSPNFILLNCPGLLSDVKFGLFLNSCRCTVFVRDPEQWRFSPPVPTSSALLKSLRK